MTEQNFRDLKVGDHVDRWLARNFFMHLIVIKVDEHLIYCDHLQHGKPIGFTPNTGWKFDRDTGCEEDADLRWGKAFGITGSYLQRKEQTDGGPSDTDTKKPIVP